MTSFNYKRETNHQHITDLVVSLFDITKNNRNETDKYFDCSYSGFSKIAYLNQFCTMTIGANRGSGHTTSILDLIETRKLNTVVISPTIRHTKDMQTLASSKSNGISWDYPNIIISSLVEFYQVDQYIQKHIGMRHTKTDLIAFDMSFMYEKGTIDKIKEIVISSHVDALPFFLFVQPKL